MFNFAPLFLSTPSQLYFSLPPPPTPLPPSPFNSLFQCLSLIFTLSHFLTHIFSFILSHFHTFSLSHFLALILSVFPLLPSSSSVSFPSHLYLSFRPLPPPPSPPECRTQTQPRDNNGGENCQLRIPDKGGNEGNLPREENALRPGLEVACVTFITAATAPVDYPPPPRRPFLPPLS